MSESLVPKMAALFRAAFANAAPGLIAALLFYWTPSVQTPDARQAARTERSEAISVGGASKAGPVGHAGVASEVPPR
ncbi:hypothetical protein [Methylocystis iwaonis]|uniref:hypothetical protein n=1 Tax=Methylocystis iwaonis TaxID=2885079 RepID=UPI002E7B0F4D|nr:hypothetical protein [Methylocystis iwaonis]